MQVLGSITIPDVGFILWSRVWTSPGGWFLSQCFCAIAPVAMSSQRNHYWNSQCSQMQKTNFCLSPPGAHISLFQHYENQLARLKHPVRTRLISPCSVIKACDVFSNGVLLSSFGEKPRTLAIAYNEWCLWLTTPKDVKKENGVILQWGVMSTLQTIG